MHHVPVTARRAGTEAFERFFLDEHPKLVALGLAWTGSADAARDLAQEALARAFRSWSTVELLDLPGAWARRVMLTLLIDHRRRAERDVRATELPGTADDAWWQAVRALPDRELAAVTLHYVEDLPIAAVAEILEVQPGTVKASLGSARQVLRAALGGST